MSDKTMPSRAKNIKPQIFRMLDDEFLIAGCLDGHDIKRAADQGIATLINILPEDDEMCILSDQQAGQIAAAHGMDYRHMPIYGHQLNNETFARTFGELVAGTTGPRLVYCRSGMRSAFLWGMIHAADLGVEEVLDRALDIGFDLSIIKDELQQMAQKPSPLVPFHQAA